MEFLIVVFAVIVGIIILYIGYIVFVALVLFIWRIFEWKMQRDYEKECREYHDRKKE